MGRRPRIRATVAALGLAIVLACSTTPPPQPPDIMGLHPHHLLDSGLESSSREAQRAYREGRFEDAARAWASLLRIRPGDSVALYNLACCYGLLGADVQAAEFVAAAWGAGFRDLEQIRSDPDFDRVRSSPAWSSLMAVLEASLTPSFEVRAPWAATVFVGRAGSPEPTGRSPLVVGLHGYNATPEPFADLFAGPTPAAPFLICAPRAPYAVGGSPGFSWFAAVPGARETDLQEELAAEYVLAVVDAMAERYPVDRERVYLLGFSQGARVALGTALRHPGVFAGVISIGGPLRSVLAGKELSEAAKALELLICHSPEDEAVPFAEAEAGAAALEAVGARVQVLTYRGGHTLDADLAAAIARWLARAGGSVDER